jgi:NDP-sugar pyrophosphorylase family protein
MQGVILAGGLGTRLYPVTKTIPKSLVPVAGRPFIDLQLELLRRGGVDDVILLVGHMGDEIRSHLGDGSRLGVRVRYSDEGAQRLDTAGAVRQALELLDDVFFLTFGDSYLILPYQRIWDDYRRSGGEALMVVYRNDNQFDSSDVLVEGGRVLAYQKQPPLPGAIYINDGLHVIRRESIAVIGEGQRMSLQQFLQPIIMRGGLVAWETQQRFFEIGSFAGLKELEDKLFAESEQ